MQTNIDHGLNLDVDLLFRSMPDKHDFIRRNPVTGGSWLNGVDPISHQKRLARQALHAREWWRVNGPKDAPVLPLSYGERECIKGKGGLLYIVALFARSLAMRDFVLDGHPLFDEYACGVLASPDTPDFIRADTDLLKRYSPQPLPGLGAGLIWRSGR